MNFHSSVFLNKLQFRVTTLPLVEPCASFSMASNMFLQHARQANLHLKPPRPLRQTSYLSQLQSAMPEGIQPQQPSEVWLGSLQHYRKSNKDSQETISDISNTEETRPNLITDTKMDSLGDEGILDHDHDQAQAQAQAEVQALARAQAQARLLDIHQRLNETMQATQSETQTKRLSWSDAVVDRDSLSPFTGRGATFSNGPIPASHAVPASPFEPEYPLWMDTVVDRKLLSPVVDSGTIVSNGLIPASRAEPAPLFQPEYPSWMDDVVDRNSPSAVVDSGTIVSNGLIPASRAVPALLFESASGRLVPRIHPDSTIHKIIHGQSQDRTLPPLPSTVEATEPVRAEEQNSRGTGYPLDAEGRELFGLEEPTSLEGYSYNGDADNEDSDNDDSDDDEGAL